MRHYKLVAAFVVVNLLTAGFGIVALKESDKLSLPHLRGHDHWVQHVAFSPDGKLLASAAGVLDRVGEIKIWDTATGAQKLFVRAKAGAVYGVAFSPDGRQLAAANDD